MKIRIITVGTPQLSFAKDGINEYYKRLSRFVNCELHHVKENKQTDQRIVKLIEGYECILLDETGKEYTTKELSRFLEKEKNQSHNLAIIIGGPNGHSDEVGNLSAQSLSLSQLTFPHDLAMMLVLETLYRSFSILENHPYHRD
ncbi:MAG: 23S rRNA (pseudouridine(1915)-N(3))-methyltransferase RlmH [Candidatus Pacebacteria bacterium]|nr:23S rRNA (pseudouridine(1915)-N(3))-methyltransferase RlmH [Candidatus Paceibacterota bacterium]